MLTNLPAIAKLIRRHILTSTTAAGSGHPTSSLSATDVMAALIFGGFFRTDLNEPLSPNNDRLIFSKGHAAPLFYALYAAAGVVSEAELLQLRKFTSSLEGHPTMNFPYTETATGSLGQGLSVGIGMAINAKYLDQLPYRTYVLLGDSEMAEGSVWEAMALAVHYKLDNLVAIVDVNRLGQRGETMCGYDMAVYKKKAAAFGWEAITIDGHNLKACAEAFKKALKIKGKPIIIIAKTVKGKGISFLENKDGWHGQTLSKEQLEAALKELGSVDMKLRGKILIPKKTRNKFQDTNKSQISNFNFQNLNSTSTRKAYGQALVKVGAMNSNVIVLDAETSNSTFTEFFKNKYPKRFFEMYIAEQNMVGTALGLSRRGKIPFVSTFAAFFTRAFDQIRMSQYSDANIKFCGSHAGVSIGEDGASQMGLEDIALFRSIQNCVVLYPSDGVSTTKLVELAASHYGNVYIRATRMDTAIIYNEKNTFEIGGSKVIKQSKDDVVTIIGAGITLHEAAQAYEELKKIGVTIRVIDLYSIKPIDTETLRKAADETKMIIIVEDHYPEGGIGEAVMSALADHATPVRSLAVRKMPRSGKSRELLDFEEISAGAIVKTVKEILKIL